MADLLPLPLTPDEERELRAYTDGIGVRLYRSDVKRLFATLDQVRAERDALRVDLGSALDGLMDHQPWPSEDTTREEFDAHAKAMQAAGEALAKARGE